jgi:L-arabinose isomerase
VNHIGDVNKLVSDTPRTDAELEFDPTSVDEVLDWSRQLERELNAANERISKLNDYVAALETAGDEMANELSYGYDVDMWNKARGEAKP